MHFCSYLVRCTVTDCPWELPCDKTVNKLCKTYSYSVTDDGLYDRTTFCQVKKCFLFMNDGEFISY